MKVRIFIAFIFYATGLLKIIDWFVFWNRNKSLVLTNRSQFLSDYIERFPQFIKPLFYGKPEPAALVCTILFSLSGLLFLKLKNPVFKILAISAFIFSFWNLFSIM